MQKKANLISLGCVALIALVAMALGVRGMARAVGMFQAAPAIQAPEPDERPMRHPRVVCDTFSPDAYREELLK